MNYLVCLEQSSVQAFLDPVSCYLLITASRDVGLVHDELALPDTSKGQVPEIAVDDVLKASANERHFLVVCHVRPQPASNNSNK